MNEHINLDDSVLAPKRPLSVEPADTEGHVKAPLADDAEYRFPPAGDSEGHVRAPLADDAELRSPPADDTEGHVRF